MPQDHLKPIALQAAQAAAHAALSAGQHAQVSTEAIIQALHIRRCNAWQGAPLVRDGSLVLGAAQRNGVGGDAHRASNLHDGSHLLGAALAQQEPCMTRCWRRSARSTRGGTGTVICSIIVVGAARALVLSGLEADHDCAFPGCGGAQHGEPRSNGAVDGGALLLRHAAAQDKAARDGILGRSPVDKALQLADLVYPQQRQERVKLVVALHAQAHCLLADRCCGGSCLALW